MEEQKIDIERRLDDLTNYTQGSLNFIETKNGAFLAVCCAITTAILSANISEPHLHYLLYISLIPLLVCILLLAASFYPINARSKQTEKKKNNNAVDLFSCENIAAMNIPSLEKQILEDSERNTLDSFQQQKLINIQRRAQAAARKFIFFRNAIKWFGVFLLFFIFFSIKMLLKV